MTEARKVLAGWSCTQPFHDCVVEPGTCADCLKMADERLAALAAAGMEIVAKADPVVPTPPGVLSEAEIAEIEKLEAQPNSWNYMHGGSPLINRLIASHRALSVANATLVRERDEARRALEPFARSFGWHNQRGDVSVKLAFNGNPHDLRGDLVLQDFRNARAALPSPSESK